ncbi:tetratricopeptide repeat protein [Nonomuraea sp. NPDC050556]|uniref:AfsR/SARP family transcriptional regulator n=1 Tax=Nonomuraea sp. NPDC050556 TaxID=3364369 RepID=UPI0037AF75EE
MGARFTLLGPVEVRGEGGQVPRWEPRHRALLAYLLLHAGTVISTDRLIGALWGTTPPDTARSQVHTLVAAVRRVLREAGAEQVLQSRTDGYVIFVEPGQLDLEEFTELAAGDRFRQALSLFQGEPLAGIRADYVQEARARLEERRLRVIERLAEAELSLGRHAQLADELAQHVAAHPLREKLVGQLMLALHRSGRQAEALAAARSFRAALVEQQGLDPSRAFAAIEQAVLRDSAEPAPPSPSPSRRVSYLPYDLADFTGRAAEIDMLLTSWSPGQRVVTITAIDGMAGIGKTSLAVHAAHRLAESFPDGQLFVDLHAHTTGQSPIEPGAALEILLRQLGVPAERLPAPLADRSALWRAELADRRALIVLDNALDADQVRPLLPGASHSLVLITGRRRLVDLDGAQTLSLEVLTGADALELFTTIVGERALAEPLAALDVVQLCGFLPLAVRIAAARLRHRPRWNVTHLADRLRDQRKRLSELSTAERGVAAAFTLSYQHLGEDQQRMFRLLGLHPGIDVDPHAAAALAGLPVDTAEALLEDLLDTHMLLQHEPGRYTLHDLLRQHARATAADEESTEERDAALTLLLDHYLHTAAAAMDLLYPDGRELRPRLPEPDEPPFTDRAEAEAWLATERDNLVRAASSGLPAHAVQLSPTLHRYLAEHTHHTDARTLHDAALRAARKLGDAVGEGRALVNLGATYWHVGEYGQAEASFVRAMELHRATGDHMSEARALNDLGGIHFTRHDYDQAHSYYSRFLELCRRHGVRTGEAVGLGNLANVADRRGEHAQAGEYYRQVLDLARESGNRGVESKALEGLGLVHQRLGDYARARDYYGQMLELSRELGNRLHQSDAYRGLGEAARGLGEQERAVSEYATALSIADEADNRPRQAWAHTGLARAHRDLGNEDLARVHAVQALDLFTGLGLPEADEVRGLVEELALRPA